MKEKKGKFRFTYFTDKYLESLGFYENKLAFSLEHSWDRNENDKGALFAAGVGLIEILHRPNDEESKVNGLDYRIQQGAFMSILVGT